MIRQNFSAVIFNSWSKCLGVFNSNDIRAVFNRDWDKNTAFSIGFHLGKVINAEKIDLMVHITESLVDKNQRQIDFRKHVVDDKKVFHENMTAAKSYIKASKMLNHNIEIIGTHLIIVLNLSHFAITYIIQENSPGAQHVLMRKYILTFSSLIEKKDLEIVITVRVVNDNIKNLKDFLKFMPYFDSLIQTAQYEK